MIPEKRPTSMQNKHIPNKIQLEMKSIPMVNTVIPLKNAIIPKRFQNLNARHWAANLLSTILI